MIDAGPYTEIVEYVREHEPEIWTEVVIRVAMHEGWRHRSSFYVDKNGFEHDLHRIQLGSPDLDLFFDMFGRLKKQTVGEGHDWFGIQFRMLPNGEFDTKFYQDPEAFHDGFD